jgi:pyruvate/2-oxoglutarate/acetoin dehydrogenase E1 component
MNNKGNLMNGDLNTIVDNVVTDLELHQINHSGPQITLFGQAATEQEVMQYVRKLQDTGRFLEITIIDITRIIASDNSTDVMNYSLTLKLKKG